MIHDPARGAYKFRLCFQLSGEGTFSGDREKIEFSAGPTGQSLTLSPLDGEKTMKSSSRFSLIGGQYQTEQEALASAEAARTAVLMYATTNRIGINVGQHSIRGFVITDEGKRMLSEQFGEPIIEDHLGITIFEAEPAPRFVGIHAKGVVGKSTEAFIESVERSFQRLEFNSPRAELAAELYTASHFETSANARFLALFMTLEALMTPAPRSQAARKHVEQLIDATKAADIPDDDKRSLAGAIAWLKNQSIAQTGQRMANELLGDATYQSLRAGEFFNKLYKTRNDLVHRGVVDRDALHILVGDADQFVSDILRRHFVDPNTTNLTSDTANVDVDITNPEANTTPAFSESSPKPAAPAGFLDRVGKCLVRYYRRFFD
jgi:hypothetical protein